MPILVREFRRYENPRILDFVPLKGIEDMHRLHKPFATANFLPPGKPSLTLEAQIAKKHELPIETLPFDNKKTLLQIFVPIKTKSFEIKIVFPKEWNKTRDFTSHFFELTAPGFQADGPSEIKTFEDAQRRLSYGGSTSRVHNRPSTQFTSIDFPKIIDSSSIAANEKTFVQWILGRLSFGDDTLAVSLLKRTGISIYNELTFKAFKSFAKDPDSVAIRNLNLSASIDSMGFAAGVYNERLVGSFVL